MAIRTVCMAALALGCLVEGSALAAQTARMQAMPSTNTGTRQMMLVQKPADEEAATNAAIDSRLARFAAANANNPSVQDAIDGAAAELRANPDSYIGADGGVELQAMSGLLKRHFNGTGTVILPSAAIAGPDNYANLGNMGDGDIMAIAFIVMMDAAKSAREDLKSIMAGVKAINQQKRDMRATVNQLDALKADCVAHPENCEHKGIDSRVLQARQPGQLNAQDVDAAEDRVKNQLDSKSEMGEMESLRLQMAMDRLSKLMSTLSNLLKKESETSDSIIQNIK